jgi:hypothetical protein
MGRTPSRTTSLSDADLGAVLKAWPRLSPALRQAILAIARPLLSRPDRTWRRQSNPKNRLARCNSEISQNVTGMDKG